jgi:AcrR family transcriptional regulator
MPKIAAETVAEHVARQDRNVFEAAVRLFVERGYEQVTFGDIADEVGLARNSLYRYYPSKAAILARWIEAELDDAVERSTTILGGDGPASERIMAWAENQVTYSRRPEHTLLVAFSTARAELDEELLRSLGEAHDRLNEPLIATLREAGVGESADLAAGLIFGLVERASAWPTERDDELRPLLRAGIRALVPTP